MRIDSMRTVSYHNIYTPHTPPAEKNDGERQERKSRKPAQEGGDNFEEQDLDRLEEEN